jgi:uncharacterized protein (DUF1778 family)
METKEKNAEITILVTPLEAKILEIAASYNGQSVEDFLSEFAVLQAHRILSMNRLQGE